VTRVRFVQVTPGGSAISARSLWELVTSPLSAEACEQSLLELLPGRSVDFFVSGRAALCAALAFFARKSGRSEVCIPAYTCFSVPAAAVAAGLRVRLLDVSEIGRIAPEAWRRAPLERTAAVVVCNLFGLPEPVAELAAACRAAGCALIDDAAQALGARNPEGPVGTRGAVGVLSFGRGKPLSALGGGALLWSDPPEDFARPERPQLQRVPALLRALLYDIARSPFVFPHLAAIPALGIGETRFAPDFPRGSIERAALALLIVQLRRFEQELSARRAVAVTLADRISSATRFRPLLPAAPTASASYPRLALLAPDAGTRARALERLAGLGAGASAFYPAALDAVPVLQPHRVEAEAVPAARELAARVLTLPTHGGLRGRRLESVLSALLSY